MFKPSIRMLVIMGLTAALAVIARNRAVADAIVIVKAMGAPTVAEFFIEEGRVRVELEIGVESLEGFRNLLPDELLRRMGKEPAPLAERLPRFFAEDLTLRADDGPPLPGRVVSIEGRRRIVRDDITGEPLPMASDEGEAVVYVQLVYPFEGQPETLSFKPPQRESNRGAAVTIGFMTYHLGLPVMDFRYLSREETVTLDWDDPWYSKFQNRNLWRQYDAPINAFLYAEPYEIRVEIIIRPKDLQHWVNLGLEGQSTIPVDAQSDLLDKVGSFIAEHVKLSVNGEAVSPTLDRINFLRRTLRSSTVITPPEELDVASATLGVILVHPTTGLPREAALTWDLFAAKMPKVRAAATDEAGPLPFILMPDDNVLVWKNFLKKPTVPSLAEVEPPPSPVLKVARAAGWVVVLVLAFALARNLRRNSSGQFPARRLVILTLLIILVGGSTFAGTRHARVTEERARGILSALLKNVYHAFDFRNEDLIYDTLAHSVRGELLTEIYLETRKGLELASQGGARVKVKNVELLEVSPRRVRGESGFRARTRWKVTGSVGHWGHVHRRTNQYEAEFTIQPVEGAWKITDLQLLQEERIS